jgi:hypothetical protein
MRTPGVIANQSAADSNKIRLRGAPGKTQTLALAEPRLSCNQIMHEVSPTHPPPYEPSVGSCMGFPLLVNLMKGERTHAGA